MNTSQPIIYYISFKCDQKRNIESGSLVDLNNATDNTFAFTLEKTEASSKVAFLTRNGLSGVICNFLQPINDMQEVIICFTDKVQKLMIEDLLTKPTQVHYWNRVKFCDMNHMLETDNMRFRFTHIFHHETISVSDKETLKRIQQNMIKSLQIRILGSLTSTQTKDKKRLREEIGNLSEENCSTPKRRRFEESVCPSPKPKICIPFDEKRFKFRRVQFHDFENVQSFQSHLPKWPHNPAPDYSKYMTPYGPATNFAANFGDMHLIQQMQKLQI